MPIFATAKTSHQWWRLSVIRDSEHMQAYNRNIHWTVGIKNLLRIFGDRICKYLIERHNNKNVLVYWSGTNTVLKLTKLQKRLHKMMSTNDPMEMIWMHHEQTKSCQWYWCICSRQHIVWKIIWKCVQKNKEWVKIEICRTYPPEQVCKASGRHVSKKCGLNSPNITYCKSKNKTHTRNYSKVISRQIHFAWNSHTNWNKKNPSKHTFMPSMTNKCNVMPNMYSLNHCHALRADSTKRDDFSETGTK